jgi:hypothetical protein
LSNNISNDRIWRLCGEEMKGSIGVMLDVGILGVDKGDEDLPATKIEYFLLDLTDDGAE